jgi:asparagine synthase (glutamine-hydrolysing)
VLVARVRQERVVDALAACAADAAGASCRVPGPAYRYLVVASGRSRWRRADGRVAAVAGQVYPSPGAAGDPVQAALGALTAPGPAADTGRRLAGIDGEFCAVLIDPAADRMVLAASRLGLPALYMYHHGPSGTLLTGDDLDELLAAVTATGRGLRLDRGYLGYYLTGLPDNAFSAAPVPTAYAEISTVPPGSLVAAGGPHRDPALRATRYWSYWDGPAVGRRGAAERVRAAFLRAVADRAEPGRTGVLLSGGLDSSSVAGALAHLRPDRRLFCYTNVFDRTPSADERLYAEAMVAHTGATGRFIPGDEQWTLRGVPDPARRPQPEPYQGWFYRQEQAVARAARADGVTVLLDGVGGDELFAVSLGAGRYRPATPQGGSPRAGELRTRASAARRRGRLRLAPPSFEPAVLPDFVSAGFAREVDLADRIRQPIADLARVSAEPVIMNRLFSFHFLGNAVGDCTWAEREVQDPHGIAGRHPFLDHRLVELVFALPISELVRPALKKALLRAALGDLLPALVAGRKHGVDFGAVFHRGMAAEGARLRAMMDDALVYQLGVADPAACRSAVRDLTTGRVLRTLANPFHEMHLWQLLTLELWLRDRARSGGVPA